MRTSSLESFVSGGTLGINDCNRKNASLNDFTRVRSRAAFFAVSFTLLSRGLVYFVVVVFVVFSFPCCCGVCFVYTRVWEERKEREEEKKANRCSGE